MLIAYLVVVSASLEHCSGFTWVTTCNPVALYQRLQSRLEGVYINRLIIMQNVEPGTRNMRDKNGRFENRNKLLQLSIEAAHNST